MNIIMLSQTQKLTKYIKLLVSWVGNQEALDVDLKQTKKREKKGPRMNFFSLSELETDDNKKLILRVKGKRWLIRSPLQE